MCLCRKLIYSTHLNRFHLLFAQVIDGAVLKLWLRLRGEERKEDTVH